MVGRSAGVLTACALGASAFLIPADVSADAFTEKRSDLIVHSLNAKSLMLKLSCSECAFSYNNDEKVKDVDDDGWFTIQGGANSVLVNFTISEDGQRLEANGEPVYPIVSAMADMFNAPRHYVKQVPESATLLDIADGEVKSADLEVTAHGVSIMSEEKVSQNGDNLIPIKYTIFELNNQPVSVDEVTIQLLSTKEHDLLIAHDKISKRPTPRPDDSFGHMPEELLLPAPSSEDSPPKECKNLPAAICKLRNMIEDKIVGMQNGVKKGKPGCHGRKGKHGPPGFVLPNHIRPHFHKDGEDGEKHHGRPHHMGHHGHYHNSFYHAFTRGLSAVLVPTMAGIAVGMAVSLIGLIVGRLIGFFWIRYYRGGRRGYSSVARDELNAENFEAAKEFEVSSTRTSMESAPPLYEHAPAYEVIEKEEE
ncbi:hypothetical protein CLAFUW4_05392 [Fulvia fulva]|uniref:DUF7728 domain-containing protein n=1 Tax=Passalora fulva TaxID=5499 RepID=A0A9Q8LI98_PASFU|nr:uncharacterized protein CLAFUR5_05539 [Fulvia fulva]KAK4623552.1 hypothetical protein CLAFUR4_05386 [Fulvia fulva]KAK4625277.1 hypothetical protein CLAFUR0_05394 [Fulvia fulva]UJO17977.1 hypothetical protein CLAFUR5_05539 [Fulvia fulva]WPV14584.1 hypothetical protein CLAFUW4_05392 [Fulvia fulva]WPV29833.1 hypothetical protein CLAFUW7_05390 [Fulvia fulva]